MGCWYLVSDVSGMSNIFIYLFIYIDTHIYSIHPTEKFKTNEEWFIGRKRKAWQ